MSVAVECYHEDPEMESEPQSILETQYKEPSRPFSQKELKNRQFYNYKGHNLSNKGVVHSRCNHYYKVKRFGQKFREIEGELARDVGNCSVCWKIRRASNHQQDLANDITISFLESFYPYNDVVAKKRLTFYDVELENVFYTWLYSE